MRLTITIDTPETTIEGARELIRLIDATIFVESRETGKTWMENCKIEAHDSDTGQAVSGHEEDAK